MTVTERLRYQNRYDMTPREGIGFMKYNRYQKRYDMKPRLNTSVSWNTIGIKIVTTPHRGWRHRFREIRPVSKRYDMTLRLKTSVSRDTTGIKNVTVWHSPFVIGRELKEDKSKARQLISWWKEWNIFIRSSHAAAIEQVEERTWANVESILLKYKKKLFEPYQTKAGVSMWPLDIAVSKTLRKCVRGLSFNSL